MMALATTTVADAHSESRYRRSALKAARGAALVAHSASGLAMPCDKEAEKLLRAAEGLIRAAAALLEFPHISTIQSSGIDVSPAAATSGKQRTTRNRRKPNGKKDDTIMDVEVRPVEEHAAVAQPLDGDKSASQTAAASFSAPIPRRTLKARSSRERSPRRSEKPPDAVDELSGPVPPADVKVPFNVGDTVIIRDPMRVPPLNGTHGKVDIWDLQTQRLAVKLENGEVYWSKLDNLQLLFTAVSPNMSRDAAPFAFGLIEGSDVFAAGGPLLSLLLLSVVVRMLEFVCYSRTMVITCPTKKEMR